MTALVVDDNTENLYLLESILRSTGYDTVSARNGAEALGQAHKQKPDLIITDILMPVMDGYTFCRECKRDDGLKDIPFVVYTATYTDPKDEEFALSLGADKFILKPQEPEVFVDLIKDIVDQNLRRKGPISRPIEQPEAVVLKEYNQTLIRKLEDKMRQTEDNERRLKAYVAQLEESLQERKRAEEQVRATLREKEILLKEVHHRVKNNMQVVSSMLKLQSDASSDPAVKSALRDTILRIRAMASIHESLYRSKDYAEVNIGAYIRSWLRNTVDSVEGGKPEWNIHVEDIHLGLDKSVPCGLLFSEIVTCVLNEMVRRGKRGALSVDLRKIENGNVELRVMGDASQGAADPGGRSEEQLGRTLIDLLVDQLEGTVDTVNGDPASVVVRFPA